MKEKTPIEFKKETIWGRLHNNRVYNNIKLLISAKNLIIVLESKIRHNN